MRITFHCGTSVENWSPRSPVRGVGGSQEAVIELSRRLQAHGHQVHVFNSCGAEAGVYGGVRYHEITVDPPHEPCDIRIVWRNPWLLDRLDPSDARRTYLWLHETVAEKAVMARVASFDRLIVLSDYHRSVYPRLPDQRIFRSGNGIDADHFRRSQVRDPLKVVYGSSYARGLETLLDLWETVVKEVPDASLTVFYGWQTMWNYSRRPVLGWRRFLRRNPITFLLFKRRIESRMARLKVHHLGRIGHAEVARQFLSAGIWGYPTWAPETCCITAMKAQAAGAIPVVIPNGALAETVRYGRKTTCTSGRRAREEWLEALLELLRNPETQEAERRRMMADARNRYSWDTVTAEWLCEFSAALSG